MAEKKYVQFTVKIPNGYDEADKIAIAQNILDFVRHRTAKGLDKDGNTFPKYSKQYMQSLDFKNAKGGNTKVNLELSGDMLAANTLIKMGRASLTLGYDPKSPEAGRVEGNVRGTYGQKNPIADKARNFLGISKEDLAKILKAFPVDDEKARALQTTKVLATNVAAQTIAAQFEVELPEEP